jgi:hypothetical protein
MSDLLTLKEIINEKHSLFKKYNSKISDVMRAYDNDNMKHKLIQFKRETDPQFIKRKEITTRINYLKFFVDLTYRGIFSNNEKNIRKFKDNKLNKYVLDIDRQGNDVDQIMKNAAKLAYLGRQSYILIDNNSADEFDNEEVRPYVQVLSFSDIINWSVDRSGYYNWVLIKYKERLDRDPFKKIKEEDRYILYTRERAIIFDKEGTVKKNTVNSIGVVPLVRIFVQDINRDGIGEGISEELLDIDMEIMALRSLYNVELYKILFNILAIQGYKKGDKAVHTMSESTILNYDKESRNAPRWLTPEVTTLKEKRIKILENVNEMIRIAGFKGKETIADRAAQTGVVNFLILFQQAKLYYLM